MTSPGLISVRFLTQQTLMKNVRQNTSTAAATPSLSSRVLDKTPVEEAQVQGLTNDMSFLESVAAVDAETIPIQEHRNQMQHAVAQIHAEEERPLTWQKVLSTPSMIEAIPVSPRPTSPSHPKVAQLPNGKNGKQQTPWRNSSNLIFFLSLLVIFLVSIGSAIFGFLITSGHSTSTSHVMMLVASSNTVSIGATLELRGSNFTPDGRVGLTRDATIPIADTGGNSIIMADKSGNFTDTITITPDWQAGLHTVNAEDAKLHKLARFSLLVTGKSISLRPAHFSVSTANLDFGSGDSATNTLKTITLSNGGGGQVTWQASTDQAWLMLSPDNGTFTAGKNVPITVAADRATVSPGSYTAHVKFLSNVGTVVVTAKMSVVPLAPGHDAVLQVSPAVLAFTATDGGTAPPAQAITVSNPGVKPLQWNVSSNVSWLSITPRAGTIQNSASPAAAQSTAQSVNIGVNTSSLLPGTYSGVIAFSGQGQVMNSTQNVLVTITITPQCSLQLTPSVLTFAEASQQSTPVSKTITVGTTQSNCSAPIQWSATTNASWLTLGTASGNTPSTPTVSVNSANLQPGTYTSSIVFSTSSGTNTLPVTFTVSQGAKPILNVPSSTLTYTSVIGQSTPLPQNITITNSGSSLLKWQASASTSVGGNWLTLAQSGGSIAGSQSAALSVAVSTLTTPGTYNGTVTITGTDASGNAISSGTQVIPVTFVVQGACSFTTSTSMLSFTGIARQTTETSQPLTIATSGACSNGISWSAAPSASWLVSTPASGIATQSTAGGTSIGVILTSLTAGTYTSNVTVTAIDSVTRHAVGSPLVVSIALTVQAACTLQAPSVSAEKFTTTAGQSPAAQTFTISASGACTKNVTVTPTATMVSGSGWLSVTPTSASLASGGSATFTVAVAGASLTPGAYNGSILLTATNGGATIAGSPQSVGVSVMVSSSAALSASAGAASTHANGVSSQPVNIANSGTGTLDWSATLSNAPSFITLGTSSGTLAAGTNTSTGVVVDASSAPVGSYTIDVIVVGTDPASGQAVPGSPITVAINVTVAAPSMQVDNTSLTYATNAGSSPAPQSINISNIGGGVLTWRISAPSVSWLSVSPLHGRDLPNVTSSPVFTVDASALGAGTYSTTVTITPSVGDPVTVSITLTVTAVSPTPTPTIGITPTVDPTVGVTPTPDLQPTPTVVTPTSTPDSTVATPTPTPDASAPTPSPTA